MAATYVEVRAARVRFAARAEGGEKPAVVVSAATKSAE
jgi:hypothetical protein